MIETIITHLTTATPLAFIHFTDIYGFPPRQLIDWAIAADAGSIFCAMGLVRQIPKETFCTHAEFLQSLYSFEVAGSTISNALSQIFEELRIPAVNIYGATELGRILYASKAPYTQLQPIHRTPLVHPISEYKPDGSRYVEFWLTPEMLPRLAHQLAHGRVLMKLEPFPGDGPHKGELAVKPEDIFQELTTGNEPVSETVYVHVGRHTDEVRLGEGGFGSVDGALYEAALGSEINARIGRSSGCPWTLDGAQLFGNNMTCTALVIQLRLDRDPTELHETNLSKDPPICELYESVEEANRILGLVGRKRVHTGKRTLIIGSDGTALHGPGSERVAGPGVLLSMTHKRTLKRWENVCKFKPWLDGLDFSES
ncbi:unnamed protein product [Rhizoctonia solani]|uniref:Uncharacterized protein n=1 Tax=Rhizoctonia solani TaxID=456999 RepID=A0A8H3H626_9AGAM|nr:unnamed protein product [Rhizoctonia solani]